MRARKIIPLAAGLPFLIAGTAALAHHGKAAYGKEEVTFQATVTEFRFINPHVQIYFDITSEDGELQHWQGELTAPNRLARGGWTKTTFKPGDMITITGVAARNGGHSVAISKILLPDGESIPMREILD
jgi:hypothetical protein